jgi:NAD(P)-dependent dehydrogenase (short-subunit alcohol dehydrogenase family)
MTDRLAGKTALVTGSTSNIGAAIAERFAAEGAHVIVSGRNAERGAAVVARIRAAGGRADFVPAELDGSKERSEQLASAAVDLLGGRLDVLVNNAGIFPGGPTTSIAPEIFDEVFAVNVKAPFFLVAAVVPAMLERGSGAIINMGSWGARLGIAGSATYTASKGGPGRPNSGRPASTSTRSPLASSARPPPTRTSAVRP